MIGSISKEMRLKAIYEAMGDMKTVIVVAPVSMHQYWYDLARESDVLVTVLCVAPRILKRFIEVTANNAVFLIDEFPPEDMHSVFEAMRDSKRPYHMLDWPRKNHHSMDGI